jgi:hypothetical protein
MFLFAGFFWTLLCAEKFDQQISVLELAGVPRPTS